MAEQVSTGLEIAKVTIPAIISALGWIIVFQQAVSIKYKDDIKDLSEKSVAVVDDIFELCTKYYTSNNDHIGILSADIRSKFLLLSHYLTLLRDKGVKTNLSQFIIDYRKAVMGDYFETTDFKKQLEIPDRRSDIANSRSALNFRIRKTYIEWSDTITFLSQFTLRKRPAHQ